MPKKSSIQTLPKDVKARLDFLIAEGALTLDDLVEFLDKHGHGRSRSAVHRYTQQQEKALKRMRQARAVTEALGKELGDAATQGKQGRLLVEMARSLVFDLLMKLQDAEEGTALDTKDVAFLGKGLAELGRALRYDQDFETKIREQVAKEAAIKLDDATAQAAAAGEQGLSADRVAQLRRDFLGVRETK